MNQDELDRLNDRTLAHDEYLRRQPDDDEDEFDQWNDESANIAEDEMMDERDGFND